MISRQKFNVSRFRTASSDNIVGMVQYIVTHQPSIPHQSAQTPSTPNTFDLPYLSLSPYTVHRLRYCGFKPQFLSHLATSLWTVCFLHINQSNHCLLFGFIIIVIVFASWKVHCNIALIISISSISIILTDSNSNEEHDNTHHTHNNNNGSTPRRIRQTTTLPITRPHPPIRRRHLPRRREGKNRPPRPRNERQRQRRH